MYPRFIASLRAAPLWAVRRTREAGGVERVRLQRTSPKPLAWR